MKKLLLLFAFTATVSVSPAAIIQFDLIGTGGPGLLFTSEPGVLSGGSGGEVAGGINFDTVSKQLTINVAWGSASGFTNLTGNATNAHVHGTANDFGNGGAGNWLQTGGVIFGLTGAPFTYNSSASAGSILGTSAALTAAQEAALMGSRYYINVHTAANGGGEIRGFLTPVPEPSAALAGLTALGALALRRRRA